MQKIFIIFIGILFFSCTLTSNNENQQNPEPYTSGLKIADHTIINRLRLGLISVADVQNAKSKLHTAYGHTSHGSQLTDGMSGLAAFANGGGLGGHYSSVPDLFAWNGDGTNGALHLEEGGGLGGDCGYYPAWVDNTRAFLSDAANSEINVIIWSWCGQAAGYDEDTMITNYLTPMNQLEIDYPNITFVYMTGHLDGSGNAGNLNQRNNQIRDFCRTNNKWLFDFADIESYDPDGTTNYMTLYANDVCNYDANGNGTTEQDGNGLPTGGDQNWATNWQNAHIENTDWYTCSSAHSQPLNANMKAYAAWWLWCRLAGGNG